MSRHYENPLSQQSPASPNLRRQLLDAGVRLAGADDIEDYLARFPELQDILPAAVRSTRHYFPDAELVLELYRDPEIEDEYLVLLVRSNRYDRETMERIRLAESAFIERLTGRNGWLQITTDFRKKADRDEL